MDAPTKSQLMRGLTPQVALRLEVRLRALRHKAFTQLFSGAAPYYVVNEYPKCGGTWLSQMLAAALEAPFRRNEPVRLERAVVHGHFLRVGALRNVVVLWRDPRDMLVSFYYHSFHIAELGNELTRHLSRERAGFLDFDDVRTNMPAFIRMLSERPVTPRFSWPEFAAVWANRPGTVQVRYEDLRADAATELVRICAELADYRLNLERAAAIADEFSFNRVKARAERELADSGKGGVAFVRKGGVGSWRDSFSPEADAMLDAYGYRIPMQQLRYTDDDQS